ncbi:DNA binding domain protein, excisionase family [Thermodesulfatator indicus DSM 15286]|uniref:DNA binding domain protein, excisionase family n=1 Tax=Thermodesulfatator indicus (strain DSM 15286 / JCM 11887 / CIR29812) TaxID=667014 RepID=F8A9Z5_THEID|nr:helix-turn-helix transcriptional regulator [Thermodesulfatator indicus]AEH44200.1 DNA binding domain protein, excisionase family [Thermodesulfatator indicus DSM 15286]
MSKDNPKSYLSTKEVAELLGVNEKIVYQLINEKGLPATKVTGKWLFPRHLVEAWLEKHVINHPEQGAYRERLLVIIGSNDPLLEKTIALYNRRFPDNPAVFASVGSMGGLKALSKRLCHIATAHLMESNERDYNFAYLKEKLEGPLPAVVNFCFREQGIVVSPGNPQGISSVEDFIKKKIRVALRPKGTGTRVLMEHELQKIGLSSEKIEGEEYASHLEVGLAVLTGKAQAGLAIKVVADLLGLDFVPLKQERYDLLIPKEFFFQENIQAFLGLLQDEEFQTLANSLSGYDVSLSGKVIFPKAATTA